MSKQEKSNPVHLERQKVSKRTVDYLVNGILILVFAVSVFLSFTAFISKNGGGVPSFFGFRPFAIQSDSMLPFFAKGDLVIDRAVKDPASLQVGDVITFWTVINGERVLNTHRITEVTNNQTHYYFTTKGDNNSVEDAIGVHQKEIVGLYLGHIPQIGTVIDYLQTGTGFLLVIVIPVFLFFVYNLVAFFKALFAFQAEKMRLQIQKEQQEATAASDTTTNVLSAREAAKTNEP